MITQPARHPLEIGCIAIAFVFAVFDNGSGSSLPWLVYCCLALLIAVSRLLKSSDLRLDVIDVLLLAYVLWMAGSWPFSRLPENSFIYGWVLTGMPLTILLVRRLTRPEQERLLQLMWLPLVVSAGWGLAEFLADRQRANGPNIDPNSWAALLNVAYFTLLARYLDVGFCPASGRSPHHAWQQRGKEALLLLLAAAQFSAYSRAGTLIWLVAMVWIAALVVLGGGPRRRLLVAGVLALIAYLLVHGYVSQHQVAGNEGYTLDAGSPAWSMRFAQWVSAWRIYLDHPFMGSGLATFKVLYPAYRSGADLNTAGNFVHNDFLELLQEGGPVQLCFALLAAGFLLWRLLELSWRWMRGEQTPACLGRLVTVLALGTAFGHALLNFTLYILPIGLILGFNFGLLLVRPSASGTAAATDPDWSQASTPVRETGKDRPRDAAPVQPGTERHAIAGRRLLPAGLALAWLAWIALAADGLSFGVVYGQAGVPLAARIREQPLDLLEVMHWMVRLRPGNSANHFALAILYGRTIAAQASRHDEVEVAAAAASAMREGLRRNPFQVTMQIKYAELIELYPELRGRLGIDESPEERLLQALRLNPTSLPLYNELARHYEQRGALRAAFTLLRDEAYRWRELPQNGSRVIMNGFYQRLERLAAALGEKASLLELERDRLALEDLNRSRLAY